uniref:Uncharacterized protein n=5 Tax=Aegilops tauschii subsp. strangulata TaxID=200361 RepID=A0A453AKN4_AEGTS
IYSFCLPSHAAFFLSSPPETPPPPATQPALLCPPSSVCFAVATVCRSGRPAAGHNLDDQRAVVHGLGGGDLRGPGAAPAPPSSVAQVQGGSLLANLQPCVLPSSLTDSLLL